MSDDTKNESDPEGAGPLHLVEKDESQVDPDPAGNVPRSEMTTRELMRNYQSEQEALSAALQKLGDLVDSIFPTPPSATSVPPSAPPLDGRTRIGNARVKQGSEPVIRLAKITGFLKDERRRLDELETRIRVDEARHRAQIAESRVSLKNLRAQELEDIQHNPMTSGWDTGALLVGIGLGLGLGIGLMQLFRRPQDPDLGPYAVPSQTMPLPLPLPYPSSSPLSQEAVSSPAPYPRATQETVVEHVTDTLRRLGHPNAGFTLTLT